MREQLLRDALGDCLPLAHVDSVVGHAAVDSLSARQELLLRTVRSLIDDGQMVVGNIVGGSDERVEPWNLSLDDAMARIYDEYVVHHDDQNWVFRTWFALTTSGHEAAEALKEKSRRAEKPSDLRGG
ncbi:hypothetical protein [Mycolicibacterium stellerae]|uniref:hypothetical protein n=1 Tax=Mycolicibacterium stellerae TaxID=2358193 RepID=UPI000F0B0EB2|nr:hypothetical protein [Mycolicibacterium stellerae]